MPRGAVQVIPDTIRQKKIGKKKEIRKKKFLIIIE